MALNMSVFHSLKLFPIHSMYGYDFKQTEKTNPYFVEVAQIESSLSFKTCIIKRFQDFEPVRKHFTSHISLQSRAQKYNKERQRERPGMRDETEQKKDPLISF